MSTSTRPARSAQAASVDRPSGARVTMLVLPGLVAAVALLLAAGGAPQPAPEGLPDPGRLTGWGIPLTDLASQLAALAVVGCLLTPVLTMTRFSDPLDRTGLRAVFTVRRIALAWALLCLAQAVLTVSDLLAVPVWQLGAAELWGYAVQVAPVQSLAAQVVLVSVVAVASRWVLSVGGAGVVLLVAVAALLPPVLTGHSSSSGSHDTAIISLALHVVTVSVWVGAVLALWWHLGAVPRLRATAARRFSVIAAWCFALTAVTGVVNASVRLGSVSAWVGTDYGRGALLKVLALGALGLVALRLRRTARSGAVGDAGDDPAWRRFAGLTGIELAVMSAAVGLGVALSRTAPPVGDVYLSPAEAVLGGPVPPAPTIGRLLLSFSPSGVGLVVVVMGLALYLTGVRRLHARGDRWPLGRTLSFLAGLLVIGYATSGGLGVYSHVLFSAHMASHMALSMIAPILLVLGAPVTLALWALPGSDVPGGTGPKQVLSALLRSRPSQVLTHPLVVCVLFVGSLYAIYFSGIFEGLMEGHLGHAFMEVHFLVVGYLYFELLIGDAPLPKRLSFLARLGTLLVVAPFHAFFAVALMSSSTAIAEPYYQLLDRGFSTDLLADQYLAGSMTWALGEVPMVMVLLVLVFRWSRDDRREAARHDRRADRDGDADLAAYNASLARMSGRTSN